MKRLLACVSLVAVTTTAAPAVTTPNAKPAGPAKHAPAARVKVAPADEYFGKLKLSILGIRNTIKDVGANVDADPNRWSGLVNKADFTEDAIRDWEHKYPADTWLAKTVFALERMYAKLDSEDGRKRSLAAMNWLVRDFGSTSYGKIGRKELAEGHVGHPIGATTAIAPPSASQIAAPAAVSSAVPGFGNPNSTTNVGAQASGGINPTPVPNPIPSLSAVGAAKSGT